MKKHYFLPFLQAACFLLINLLLQSCGGSHSLPIQGDEEPSSIITIAQEEKQQLEIEGQVSIIGANQEQEQKVNSLPAIMPELWQEIFSHLDFEGVLAARLVSADWNQLITGFREAGIVGVENKPCHIINTCSWVKRKGIDFWSNNLSTLTPATIPSFAFYHLMGDVNNLPQSFCPYLKGTQLHTLHLRLNQIGAQGAIELAKALTATQVHTLHLESNEIGDAGVRELDKALPATRVHTLHLPYNRALPKLNIKVHSYKFQQ
jgi:hypothetical protein